MSCCLFGVCVPYSAIIPLCIIGIQWVASKLASVGLLPEGIARRLGLKSNGGKACVTGEKGLGTSDCCRSSSRNKRGSREKVTIRSSSTATTASSSTVGNEVDEKKDTAIAGSNNDDEVSLGVEHIDNLTRWNEVLSSNLDTRSNSICSKLIVKFTAEWCKPCHAIQPCYDALASKYSCFSLNNESDNGDSNKINVVKFVSLDVDGEDCDSISSSLRVALMPTFVCFQNGKEVGRMNGGNNEAKLKEWVGEMCSS